MSAKKKSKLQRAVELLRRIDKAERKKAWQQGESLEAAVDACREFLGDLRTERLTREHFDRAKREQGQQ